MIMIDRIATESRRREFYLDAIGMTVDAESVRVLSAMKTSNGVVALLEVVGATHVFPLSCVLTEIDFTKVVQHGQLRPALLN